VGSERRTKAASPFLRKERPMETPLSLREKSERCRHLSHNSSDPKMQISLRKLGDDYATRADEIEHDQIVKGIDQDRASGAARQSSTASPSSLVCSNSKLANMNGLFINLCPKQRNELLAVT